RSEGAARRHSWQSTHDTNALRLMASAVHDFFGRETFHWQYSAPSCANSFPSQRRPTSLSRSGSWNLSFRSKRTELARLCESVRLKSGPPVFDARATTKK